jgi:hypothetical protein
MDKELIILAIYINVHNMSRQQAEHQIYVLIQEYENMYKGTNKDVKVYWFPVTDNQETKVECVYPPSPIMNGNIENELLKIYKLLVNSKSDEAKELIKHIERKLKLKNIIDKNEDS